MDKKFIKQQEKRLKNEKKTIEKELKRFAKKNGNIKGNYKTIMPDFGQHKDDEALEFSLYENMLPVEYNLEKRLINVNRALEKIKNNKYGICAKCKKPITQSRLEIIPEIELCIKCQKRYGN